MSETNDPTIGAMNGPWAFMAKVALATYPLVVASLVSLMVWLVVQAFEAKSFRSQGPRMTTHDGATMMRQIEAMIATHAASPHDDAARASSITPLIDTVQDIRSNQRQIQSDVQEIRLFLARSGLDHKEIKQ